MTGFFTKVTHKALTAMLAVGLELDDAALFFSFANIGLLQHKCYLESSQSFRVPLIWFQRDVEQTFEALTQENEKTILYLDCFSI